GDDCADDHRTGPDDDAVRAEEDTAAAADTAADANAAATRARSATAAPAAASATAQRRWRWHVDRDPAAAGYPARDAAADNGLSAATLRIAAGHGRDTQRLRASQKRHGRSTAFVMPIRSPSTTAGSPCAGSR